MDARYEREPGQTSSHGEQAAEHRRQAELLGRAGYRDQAARHMLEARLIDLKAAAMAATGRPG